MIVLLGQLLVLLLFSLIGLPFAPGLSELFDPFASFLSSCRCVNTALLRLCPRVRIQVFWIVKRFLWWEELNEAHYLRGCRGGLGLWGVFLILGIFFRITGIFLFRTTLFLRFPRGRRAEVQSIGFLQSIFKSPAGLLTLLPVFAWRCSLPTFPFICCSVSDGVEFLVSVLILLWLSLVRADYWVFCWDFLLNPVLLAWPIRKWMEIIRNLIRLRKALLKLMVLVVSSYLGHASKLRWANDLSFFDNLRLGNL